MASLNNGRDHNAELQELYSDDPNVIFEYVVADDREQAFDIEQSELDKWIGHPDCLNVNNSARKCWVPGTMPPQRRAKIGQAASKTHSENKYVLGQIRDEDTRERMSVAQRKRWDLIPRQAKKERPVRPGARGRVVEGAVLDNMRNAATKRGIEYSKQVSIDGVVYHNATYAAAALGYSRRTVIVRIGDDRYPEWKYI